MLLLRVADTAETVDTADAGEHGQGGIGAEEEPRASPHLSVHGEDIDDRAPLVMLFGCSAVSELVAPEGRGDDRLIPQPAAVAAAVGALHNRDSPPPRRLTTHQCHALPPLISVPRRRLSSASTSSSARV